MKLPLTPEEYREFVQTLFKFFLPIDLPTGDVTLRIGVFDTLAGKTGTLEVPLTVQQTTSPSATSPATSSR